MKPIFEEERRFLERYLGIELPKYCWKKGSYIYLNHSDKEYIVRMKAKQGEIELVNNRLEGLEGNKVKIKTKKGRLEEKEIKTWLEEYKEEAKDIEYLEEESINRTREYIQKHRDHEIRLGDSGGKDSLLAKHISIRVLEELGIEDYVVDFYNTTNETAETYKMVKQGNPKDKLRIHNPDKGWYKWLKEDKKYYCPSVMSRTCCDKYKHGRLGDILEKDKKYIMLLGMRRHESTKRGNYDWELNKALGEKNKDPEGWKRFLPIVNWTDAQVWLYILHNKLAYNLMYEKGFNRVGCLICPYASDYTDILIKEYYPKQWGRWEELLLKNYDRYGVEGRLKWTKEEWLKGRWKAGVSKDYELTIRKATPERVKELAELKGVTEEVAKKFFKKECACGKKLNPTEVAMNLKMYGRGVAEGKMECKKCFCKANKLKGVEYTEKSIEFREQKCNLF